MSWLCICVCIDYTHLSRKLFSLYFQASVMMVDGWMITSNQLCAASQRLAVSVVWTYTQTCGNTFHTWQQRSRSEVPSHTPGSSGRPLSSSSTRDSYSLSPVSVCSLWPCASGVGFASRRCAFHPTLRFHLFPWRMFVKLSLMLWFEKRRFRSGKKTAAM